MKTYSTKFLNKTVTVKMDRPMGTRHPRLPEIYYIQNYGYIPDTLAPDGSELDAYVLGVLEPLQKFTGKCIAVIHRTNDEDDKLIVVPEGKEFTDEQIIALTEFQERFYKSVIIRTA
ncbi:inorganic diphosphatase [Candidatus Peregrinibacteria bacterium]|nr:inorganic diphosphatase [Candidatus Peregrinibacteria bacterium]